MTNTVLHVLSQRPLLTGSGITLDAFVRRARQNGWEQHVVVGVPSDERNPVVGGLDAERIHPLFFGIGNLDYPVPGMSDVMPYPSTRFSSMTRDQVAAYENAWRDHLDKVIAEVKPDIIHSHHIWLASSLIKEIASDTPIVTQCHATGLRQMALCPHLTDRVVTRCRRNDRFFVLHAGHADQLSETLTVGPERIHVIGAGYNEVLFHARGREVPKGGMLLYVGKLSAAKGLPWLLDAVERLFSKGIEIELHVAGSGVGSEAESIEKRLANMASCVTYHGQVGQAALADLMRRCSVCVLPSFYEGVPLVLVEALACGCRLVSTNLPGVMSQLAPYLGSTLDLIPLPRLIGPDVPDPLDLPAFVDDIASVLERAAKKDPLDFEGDSFLSRLKPFGWNEVFDRVEAVWNKVKKSE
ncbi:MAG: glycosyltransferase family 4 protein [Deltaproteobacteria bacterium]|nr:glycosyltransferase family 4 protein [Deltaproteobacteria bacterium]